MLIVNVNKFSLVVGCVISQGLLRQVFYNEVRLIIAKKVCTYSGQRMLTIKKLTKTSDIIIVITRVRKVLILFCGNFNAILFGALLGLMRLFEVPMWAK